jgi:hypothetical protein
MQKIGEFLLFLQLLFTSRAVNEMCAKVFQLLAS